MMKQKLRKKVSTAASATEITLSFFILLLTIITGISLVVDLYTLLRSIFSGEAGWDYRFLFDAAIELIIAVEFVKMLSKHSMGSAIEVLVFVIAKRVIIGGTTASAVDVVLFVLAFAILFAVRKYLHFNSNSIGEEAVYNANTPIAEICNVYKTKIPSELGTTIGDAIGGVLSASGREATVGERVEFRDISVKIEAIKDNRVHLVGISLK